MILWISDVPSKIAKFLAVRAVSILGYDCRESDATR